MGRLPGFDYKRPFFYMVTMKGARSVPGKTGFAAAAPQLQFSRLEEGGALADTPLTPLLRAVIERFHETWWCIEPIRYYVIMPDNATLYKRCHEMGALAVQSSLRAINAS